MSRSKHTGAQTIDPTTTGAITGTQLEKRKQRRVTLRTTEADAITTDPTITLEASVDGDTWIAVDSATGTEITLTNPIPDAYVRANVTSAADAGTLTMWIAAL
ncbi:hypothetical protein [Haloarcula sp. S1AR25-4]|uniref:hypothetical protein n=1 Tax=Haloarcula sp. S1AR25-4 TaxID=2950538 RepID=UPI00287BAD92|nr:hypothetical protein [Halomicroarcula sp. S1AR25-4]